MNTTWIVVGGAVAVLVVVVSSVILSSRRKKSLSSAPVPAPEDKAAPSAEATAEGKGEAKTAESAGALDAIQRELEKAKLDIQNQNDKIRFIADIINAQPVALPAMQEYQKILATDYREFAKNNDALSDEACALLKLQEVEQ